MPQQNSLLDTIEQLQLKRQKLLEEIKSLDFTIKSLQRHAGVESQESETIEILANGSIQMSEDAVIPPVTTIGGKPVIRADEYFGLTHAEAARKYLKRVGHAVSFEELADALKSGGCKLGGINAKKILYISLIRNTRDFVPPQPGYVGLREFYGSRVGSPERTKTVKRGRPKKTRTPRLQNKAAKQKNAVAKKVKAEEKPKELPNAVKEFLSDNQAHSPQEIAKAVGKTLGRAVKVVSIHGVLRRKGTFEKVDEKYKLVNQ